MSGKESYLSRYIARNGLFQQYPVSSKSSEFESEITLMRAVIDRALLDSAVSKDEEIKEEANEWFDLGNEDFLLCCEMARLKPKDTIKRFLIVREKLLNKETMDQQDG